jgi:hypothetical protein
MNFVRHDGKVKLDKDFPESVDKDKDLREVLEHFLSKNHQIESGTLYATPTMGGWHFGKR